MRSRTNAQKSVAGRATENVSSNYIGRFYSQSSMTEDRYKTEDTRIWNNYVRVRIAFHYRHPPSIKGRTKPGRFRVVVVTLVGVGSGGCAAGGTPIIEAKTTTSTIERGC